MSTRRRIGGLLCLVLGIALSGCRTISAVQDSRLFNDGPSSQSGTAIANLDRMPFASAYVQVGTRFDALMLLGMTGPGALETWYGVKGLTVIVDDARVLYTRGLPETNLAESIDAGEIFDYRRLDCGQGRTHLAMPGLRYNRFEGASEYFPEITESLQCSIEALATPGYLGDALRIDEVIQFPPHKKTQLRTRWLHPGTGQLLRLKYSPSPYFPEVEVFWLKVAKHAH